MPVPILMQALQPGSGRLTLSALEEQRQQQQQQPDGHHGFGRSLITAALSKIGISPMRSGKVSHVINMLASSSDVQQ